VISEALNYDTVFEALSNSAKTFCFLGLTEVRPTHVKRSATIAQGN
jgi:hypothetical protein